MDDFSWINCLAMLSSEKSLPYWDNLEIPFLRRQYRETNNFFQGFLEQIIYPIVLKRNDKNNVQESWRLYRETNGVLTDDYLENNPVILSQINNTNMLLVFNKLSKHLNLKMTDDIFKWAVNYFQNSTGIVTEVSEKTNHFLTMSKNNQKSHKQGYFFVKSDFDKITQFCNRIKWRSNTLNQHFLITKEVYKMSLPNEWEMVLQDCFYESVRNSYWWMESVHHTLEYINFHQNWKNLRLELGDEKISLFIDFLENLPNISSSLKKVDFERLRQI